MLARAVGDQALAVLHHGVLFRHTAHAGEGAMALLFAVDGVIVGAIAQRHIVGTDFADHAVTHGKLGALRISERAIWIPRVGVNPALGIGDRHPGLALIVLARQCVRRQAVIRREVLADAPVQVVAIGDARCTSGESRCVLDKTKLRQRIIAHPLQAILIGVGVRVRRRSHFGRRHVQEGKVCRVERSFNRLRPVALLQFFRNVAVCGRNQPGFERGQGGRRTARPHIRPDHLGEFTRRVSLDAHLALIRGIGWHVRHLDAVTVEIEFPAVVDAANCAIFVAAEKQIRSAVRTGRLHQTDTPVAGAESDQVFVHHLDANWRAILLRQFTRQSDRLPEVAEVAAHRGVRAGARQEFVVFTAQHGGFPVVYCGLQRIPSAYCAAA